MNTIDGVTNSVATTGKTAIAGPPLLAKITTGILVVVGVVSLFFWPSPLEVSTTLVAGMAAWRLSQLAVLVDGDDLVIRNLIATSRIPLARAEARRSITDLRTRTLWGAQYLPKDAVPKMDDDNMQTHAKLIRFIDISDPDAATHTDCSIGLLPATQDSMYARFQEVLSR